MKTKTVKPHRNTTTKPRNRAIIKNRNNGNNRNTPRYKNQVSKVTKA